MCYLITMYYQVVLLQDWKVDNRRCCNCPLYPCLCGGCVPEQAGDMAGGHKDNIGHMLGAAKGQVMHICTYALAQGPQDRASLGFVHTVRLQTLTIQDRGSVMVCISDILPANQLDILVILWHLQTDEDAWNICKNYVLGEISYNNSDF